MELLSRILLSGTREGDCLVPIVVFFRSLDLRSGECRMGRKGTAAPGQVSGNVARARSVAVVIRRDMATFLLEWLILRSGWGRSKMQTL